MTDTPECVLRPIILFLRLLLFVISAIPVAHVWVGFNGVPLISVYQFANLESTSDVNNLNLKLGVWFLPFLKENF